MTRTARSRRSRRSSFPSRWAARWVTTSRARRPSTRPAAWARWLTADWLMPRRRPASSYDSPSSTRSATSQPLSVRRPRTAAHSQSTDSRSRAAGSSPTTRRCQGLFFAAVTASRAWRYAGPRPARAESGSGSSTAPTPRPMCQAPSRSRRLDGAGKRGGVVEHALDLVADGALEGQPQGQVGQAGERVGHQVGAGPAAALVDGEHHDGHRTSMKSRPEVSTTLGNNLMEGEIRKSA